VKAYNYVYPFFPFIQQTFFFFECQLCVSNCSKSWGDREKTKQTLTLIELRTAPKNLETQLSLCVNVSTIQPCPFQSAWGHTAPGTDVPSSFVLMGRPSALAKLFHCCHQIPDINNLRKDLSWLPVLQSSVHGYLAPRTWAEHHGGRSV
jgi:hypothetical protein